MPKPVLGVLSLFIFLPKLTPLITQPQQTLGDESQWEPDLEHRRYIQLGSS